MNIVEVYLDTNARPPVTCHPLTLSVTETNEMINWVPADDQAFEFTSISFGNASCFYGLEVTDDKISVEDENDAPGDYPYTVVVTLDGVEYSSAKSEIGGGGGSPSINNK